MLAYHAVISAYGFWLPNDPRGSWSDFVGGWELLRRGGKATKVDHTRSVASVEHDHAKRDAAKSALGHPPVVFDGKQARAVACGMGEAADVSGYPIYALSILPSHLHLVIAATERDPGRVIGHLKRAATDRLIAEAIHPCTRHGRITHTCWSKRAWKVFLFSDDAVGRAIRYVEDNPTKDGMRPQKWNCVKPWRAWLPPGTRAAP